MAPEYSHYRFVFAALWVGTPLAPCMLGVAHRYSLSHFPNSL